MKKLLQFCCQGLKVNPFFGGVLSDYMNLCIVVGFFLQNYCYVYFFSKLVI